MWQKSAKNHTQRPRKGAVKCCVFGSDERRSGQFMQGQQISKSWNYMYHFCQTPLPHESHRCRRAKDHHRCRQGIRSWQLQTSFLPLLRCYCCCFVTEAKRKHAFSVFSCLLCPPSFVTEAVQHPRNCKDSAKLLSRKPLLLHHRA